MDFAVIAAGGKQYAVTVGQKLALDYAAGTAGTVVHFPVLLRVHSDGRTVVGQPTLTGAAIGTVASIGRSARLRVVKFKRKVRYRRTVGHRHPTSLVTITELP